MRGDIITKRLVRCQLMCARNCTTLFRYGISLNFQQGKAMRNIGTEDILEKSFRYLLILKHWNHLDHFKSDLSF